MPAKTTPQKPPVLEWVMAGLGGLAVAATLALLLKDAHVRPSPPFLTAHVVEVRPLGPGAWAAEVEVINRGDATAAAAHVALGEAKADTDYVAGHGRARVTLVTAADPTGAAPRVLGWSEP